MLLNLECCPSAPTCASLVHTAGAMDCRDYFYFIECHSTGVLCCVGPYAWRRTLIIFACVRIICVVCTSITDVAPAMIFISAHFIVVAALVTWTAGCSVEQADNYFYYLARDAAAAAMNLDYVDWVDIGASFTCTTSCFYEQPDNYFYYDERDGCLAFTSLPFSF